MMQQLKAEVEVLPISQATRLRPAKPGALQHCRQVQLSQFSCFCRSHKGSISESTLAASASIPLPPSVVCSCNRWWQPYQQLLSLSDKGTIYGISLLDLYNQK